MISNLYVTLLAGRQPTRLRRAFGEWRLRRVLQVKLNRLCHAVPAQQLNQPQRAIDPRGDARRADVRAIDHHALVHGNRAEIEQQVE